MTELCCPQLIPSPNNLYVGVDCWEYATQPQVVRFCSEVSVRMESFGVGLSPGMNDTLATLLTDPHVLLAVNLQSKSLNHSYHSFIPHVADVVASTLYMMLKYNECNPTTFDYEDFRTGLIATAFHDYGLVEEVSGKWPGVGHEEAGSKEFQFLVDQLDSVENPSSQLSRDQIVEIKGMILATQMNFDLMTSHTITGSSDRHSIMKHFIRWADVHYLGRGDDDYIDQRESDLHDEIGGAKEVLIDNSLKLLISISIDMMQEFEQLNKPEFLKTIMSNLALRIKRQVLIHKFGYEGDDPILESNGSLSDQGWVIGKGGNNHNISSVLSGLLIKGSADMSDRVRQLLDGFDKYGLL